MNDALEDRLRRTYDAVAERTSVDAFEPPTGVGLGRRPSSPRRLAAPALVAAVVAVLVGGLVVIDRRGEESPASSAAGHVLPTLLPNADVGPTGLSGGGPRLVSIASTADTDVIEYASDDLDVSIRVDRAPVPDVAGEPVSVRDGEVATVDAHDEGGLLRWNATNGPAVTIEWTGTLIGGVDGIVEVVHGLLLVDEATWATATEHGGFTEEEALLRRDLGPIEVFVHGDLQSGLWFGVDAGLNYRGLVPPSCVLLGPGGDLDTWAVMTRFSSGTATVMWRDEIVEDVQISPFVTGSAFGVGVVERSEVDLGRSVGECEEAS